MDRSADIVDFNRRNAACTYCGARNRCLGPMLNQSNHRALLDDVNLSMRSLRRGERLFHTNDKLRWLYVVRSGSIKTYFVSEGGDEQVTGFYTTGDIIGLDAIADGRFLCCGSALEPSGVCQIPFSSLSALGSRFPQIQHELMHRMSQEINRLEQTALRLGKMGATRRVASFLFDQVVRHSRPGYWATTIALPMSRDDIANFSGMALETVSRILTRLETRGVLVRSGKEIRIRDLAALRKLVTDKAENVVGMRKRGALSQDSDIGLSA